MRSDHVLRIGVTDLLHHPGTRREVRRTVRVGPLTVGSSTVPADTEVEVDVVVESTADPGTLTVTGHLDVPWAGECRRCLGEVGGILRVDVLEVASRHPADDEVWPLVGDELDLTELVRESALLALPVAPLCGEGCRGPAPDAFPAVPAAEAAASEPGRDERWAALDQLRFDADAD